MANVGQVLRSGVKGDVGVVGRISRFVEALHQSEPGVPGQQVRTLRPGGEDSTAEELHVELERSVQVRGCERQVVDPLDGH